MDWIRSFVYGAQVIATEVQEPAEATLSQVPPAHVVSFDGGGMRGLYSIKIAQAIEDKLNGSLMDNVDMLAGASTGSILSFGLASGKSLRDLEAIYKQRGSEIFYETTWDEIKDGDGLLGPKYEAHSLEKVLKDNFSDTPLSSVSTHWVQAYSVDITSQTVKIFDTARAKNSPNEDFPIWYAIRASTAAPTYFTPVDSDGHALCDGGVSVNNPGSSSLKSIIDKFGIDALKSTTLVSIGTGVFPTGINYQNAKNMGALAWAAPISEMMIRISSNLSDDWCSSLLGARYARVNGKLTRDLPLDGYSPANIAAIETAALTYIKENPEAIDTAAKLLNR